MSEYAELREPIRNPPFEKPTGYWYIREDAISTDLTYDLRSGEADMLDQMVSLTFASLAMDCIRQGEHGWMAAVRGGRYARVPLPQGPSRRVDAARLYDSEHFCPNYANKLGLPLLLDEVADPA